MAKLTENGIRTCIACGQKLPKGQLMRIVATKGGEVLFDGSGRICGRGAYLCSGECLARAAEKRMLGRALRCNVSSEALGQVAYEIEAALAGANAR